MTDDQLGLSASVSMALGGMIGGGIYAVLGLELLYFEREWIEREAQQVERALSG